MSTGTRAGDASVAAPDDDLEQLLAHLAAADLAHAPAEEVGEALQTMVGHAEFPCLGAKSVFRRGSVERVVLDDMRGAEVAETLIGRLAEFAREIEGEDGFHSFIATFRGPIPSDEATFETSLFDLLQRLHDADDDAWAPGVGSDPTDPHFAFSVGGTAYFIVGLHPAASRVARRAPLPTLVFNPHEQFEQLREEGRFDRMRGAIRRRDEDLQGTINPMVADHGEATEAMQYSGRAHGADWQPPLEVHDPAEEDGPADEQGGHGNGDGNGDEPGRARTVDETDDPKDS